MLVILRMFIFIHLLLLQWSLVSASTAIHIGLLVNTYNENHSSNEEGQQELQAFLMGLEEVDLGANYHLEYVLSNAHGHFHSAQATLNMVQNAFNGNDVDVVISALPDIESLSTLLMLEEEKIVTIVTSARSEEMSSGRDFPHKLRLPASASYDGFVLHHLIHDYFNYDKVAIFFSADRNSVDNSLNFLKKRNGRKFHVLSEHELDANEDDYSELIMEAKHSGATVFVFFMDVYPFAKLLIQGYNLGLFAENAGQIIFSIEKCAGAELIKEIELDFPEYIPQIPKLMKGIVGIRYDPKYPLKHYQKGQQFMSNFKNRTATNNCQNNIVTGKWKGTQNSTKVGHVRDDNGAKYLYKYNSTSSCTGLDYSVYDANNLYEFTPYVYDGIKLLGTLYRKLLIDENRTLSTLNADLLMEAAFELPEYEGVTGNIKIFDGVEAEKVKYNGLYGYGDREVGHMFQITNYNVKQNKFVDVGRMDNGDAFQLCDDQVKDMLKGDYQSCQYFVEYNSPDNSRPSDTRPDILLETTAATQAFLQAIGIIGVIYVLAISALLVYRRNSKLVKASQPAMMAIVLVGELLAFVRVIFGGEHPNPDSCMSMFWFGHLAYALVFGALTIKTWRVFKIISNTSLKRMKISIWDVLRRTMILISFTVVYIIIVHSLAVPQLKVVVVALSNQSTYHINCSFKYPQFEITLYALEAVLLVYGANMCNATKDAPSAINESKPIAASISYIALISVIVLPFVSLIDLDNSTIEIISSVAFFAAGMISTTLIFLPKVYILAQGKDIDWNDQKKNNNINEALYQNDATIGTELDAELIELTSKHLHGMSVDNKYVIAQLQLVWWRNLLMKLEEKRTSSQTSNPSKSSLSTSVNMKDDDGPILITAGETKTTA